jgi:hypothetical protein
MLYFANFKKSAILIYEYLLYFSYAIMKVLSAILLYIQFSFDYDRCDFKMEPLLTVN